MDIKILQLIDGAQKAEGLTVIIDVFRAFSTACYVFSNGADMIIPVGELSTAYNLKEENNSLILMGERAGRYLPGFDYGNSPFLIKDVDFSNKIVVHTTSAGTQGIVNAKNASQIITGSFVNAQAVVNHILKERPARVSLVCMGNAGVETADEDVLCALYLKNLIMNRCLPDIDSLSEDNIDLLRQMILNKSGMSKGVQEDLLKFLQQGEVLSLLKEGVVKKILRQGSGQRFFDPANKEWSPSEDFAMCLEFNMFDFVLKAEEYTDGLFSLRMVKN